MCVSFVQRGHSSDACLSVSIWFSYERNMGQLVILSYSESAYDGLLSSYCLWCCDFS